VTRWWGVALLSLSIGLNAGLGVAVLQQRFLSAPQPAATEPPRLPDAPAGWADSGVGGTTAGGGGAEEGPAGQPLAPQPAPAAEPATRTAEPPRAAPAPPRAEPEPEIEPESDSPAGGPELAWMAPGADGQARRPPQPPPARPGGRFPAGPPEARLEEMAERLGVPAADRPRFAALQREFFVATRDGRARLDGVRRELRAELTASRPDRARIDELLARSSELQAGLERALVEHVLAAREVLDGEAERRYLHFLSRLGAAGGPGARPGPPLRRRPGLRDGRRPGRPPF
jgi:hypothetical protein